MVQTLKLSSPVVWVLVLVLGLLSKVHGSPVDFQAESGEGFQVPSIHWRSNAEGRQAVWLRNAEVLSINICLLQDDEVTVDSVRFSRDGNEQEAVVSIDGQEVGSFNTTGTTNGGLQWNVFNNTETVFDTLPLTAGQHAIEVTLRNATDSWGIEIDQISVSFASNATLADVSCEELVTGSPEATTGLPTEDTTAEGKEEVEGKEGGEIVEPCSDESC
ncbi:uncharacterized protein [Littorina saxatilis]|uniref:Uncharacterized protein n=1 Tax=Littorina saxatilis TaxID=31220 RepID=A0AAN9BXG4_9CAEN